ncbi:endolytic transglycosylase MltG [Agriterribacter sp.]|uniref:endolytic transglycosylase MltG n=1 Tax=Agriterribacter sp. TaxID=2821509 RepID=UPI002CE76991|nr:endolytic transglycosylase MltG [Agriterribacter sp.]HRP56508.1 endolytic transglycosylase MltG [Agriterribacter sp.]
MFKRLVLPFLIFLLIVIIVLTWKIMGPNTAFKGEKYYLYVKTGSNFENLMQTLTKDSVINDPGIFTFVAKKMNLPRTIKAGRYEIKRGTGIMSIVQMLRHGRQSPVNLVITKLRTKEDFARLAGRQLECDSTAVISYLNNMDALEDKGLDTSNVMTAIIPNTYTFFWNTTAAKLFNRLYNEEKKFWKEERLQKARALGLTPQQVYILASVIEEETNKYDEMPLMASVYINRLNKGMPLGADPTVKFATRNFAAKRVTLKMIGQSAGSPYNTYRNAGLPPGPICTPSIKTIDATLNAATTNYLYFCAKPDFSGYHAFAVTHAEHFKNARAYQKALNRLKIK